MMFESRHCPFRQVASGLLLLLLATAAAAQPTPTELRPGVIVDSVAGTAYVMSPGGGIDAIDIVLGTLRWHSGEAAKPLALQGRRLVAQVQSLDPGHLELVVLETDGGDRLRSSSVKLPEEVAGRIDDGPGDTFLAQAEAGPTGVTVTWTSSRRLVQGMQTDLPAARPQVLGGAVSLDPLTGISTPAAVPATLRDHPRPLLGPGERLDAFPGRQFLSADARHVS